MRIELGDPQGVLLREIADKRTKRDDVAMTYAFALRQQSEVDFVLVNRAIMDRWSIAALRYIKEKAWRLAERSHMQAPGATDDTGFSDGTV